MLSTTCKLLYGLRLLFWMKWGPLRVLRGKVIESELISKVPQRVQCRGQSIGGRVDRARPVRGHCSIYSERKSGPMGHQWWWWTEVTFWTAFKGTAVRLFWLFEYGVWAKGVCAIKIVENTPQSHKPIWRLTILEMVLPIWTRRSLQEYMFQHYWLLFILVPSKGIMWCLEVMYYYVTIKVN